MKRIPLSMVLTAGALIAAAAVTLLAGRLLYSPIFAGTADGKNAPETNPALGAARLPIGQIVLFSSGVGYFQREGTVEGNARVDLSFPVQDINDLLKSMVVRDLDGGVVSTVSYDSNAPVEKTLKSFAINLNGNPSFSAILSQARGEKVEVVLQQTNATQPGTLTGTLVGIETHQQQAGNASVSVELLNLWCADGMRSLKLGEIQRMRFLNPVMDSEFKKALETLTLSHDTQKKAVSINFAGEGKRQVKVGYVVENPIWKTSYRLVLPKEKEDKPFLQGWAVVENPTDEDWKDVRMALVSGRPISFQMDLYTPLYVPRPVVEPELYASLRPVAYSGDLKAERFLTIRDREMTEKKAVALDKDVRLYDRVAAGVKPKESKGADDETGQFGAGNATFARQVNEGLGKVNRDIAKSIKNTADHQLFPAFHNGLTVLCKTLKVTNDTITIAGYAVVNGCQSLTSLYENRKDLTSELRIITKFINVPPDDQLAIKITDHTNNQNGTTFRDLQSNNPIQVRLQSEVHRQYKGQAYYRIKRGEHPEWPTEKVIENELVARILLAFDLKQPWSCHQTYKLFDEQHAAIFGRPEVDADRIILASDVYNTVVDLLDTMQNELFGKYNLTRYVLIYLVREALEIDVEGKKLCEKPADFLRGGGGRDRLTTAIRAAVAPIVNLLDTEATRRSANGNEYFDYKSDLKSPNKIRDLRAVIIGQHRIVIDNGYAPGFAGAWNKAGKKKTKK